MFKHSVLVTLTLFCVLYLSSFSLAAHEYEAYARSATGTGRAYAGEVTKTDDASVVYANPAAMAKINGNRFSAVLHGMTFDADYQVDSALAGNSQPIGGDNTGDAGGIFGGPNLYWVSETYGAWRYGIGLNAPYAYGTEYKQDWLGRYHGTFSELTALSLSFSSSFALNENLSLGFSVPVTYVEVTFNRALNQAGRCLDEGLVCTGAADGEESVTADGFGVGFAVGIHYQFPISGTQLGLVYRAKENIDLSGDASYESIDPQLTGLNVWQNGTANIDLLLPASVSIGIAQPFGRFRIMADISWKHWSDFDGWEIALENNQAHRFSAAWQDSLRSAFAVEYYYSSALTLRLGYAYDNSPIRSASQQSPLIPGADIQWYSLGASWQRANGHRFDIGYAYLDYETARVGANSTQGGNENITLQAGYDLDLHLLSLQYNF